MKKMMSLLVLGAAAAVVTSASAAVVIPETTVLSVTQRPKGRIAVRYNLTAPAVVTFDVTTNGVSIGEDRLMVVSGDICRELGGGTHEFVWYARATIPDWRAELQVVLTAWPLNDKPPYMVVDISTNDVAAADRIRYYASSNAVPGGIVENPLYKTEAMVFRRIYARNRQVTKWGSDRGTVTMSNDYYLAVFETTQAQWQQVWQGPVPVAQCFRRDGDVRPVDSITYCYIRESGDNRASTTYRYPNPPCPDSWLGNLRTRCGELVDFDLPTVNEWIFAAAGGYGYSYWGDGTPVTSSGTTRAGFLSVCPNLDRLGRYLSNGGWDTGVSYSRAGVEENDVNHGTAIVGTYHPNAYGIYDMHGNVEERVADVPNSVYGGDCHDEPKSCLAQDSADAIGATSVFYSFSRGTYAGFRVACRNGLK